MPLLTPEPELPKKDAVDIAIEKGNILTPAREEKKDSLNPVPIQNIFPSKREALINYDYFDAAEGTGYDIYYGSKANGGECLMTTSAQIYSEEILTIIRNQNIATTATKYFDLDFDILFNKPKNIKGKLFANVPIGISAVGAVNKDFAFYVVVKAIHVNAAGTETATLATGTSKTQTQSGTFGIQSDKMAYVAAITTCIMDVTTTKHFKKGEKLRFTVEGWYRTLEAAACSANIIIAHDPANREATPGITMPSTTTSLPFGNEAPAGGTISPQKTRMAFHVPFILDI